MRLESGRTLRPRNNLVYIKLDKEKEERLSSGLVVLPDEDKKVSYGTVVAVGLGKLIEEGPREGQRIPVEVSPGDQVVFSKYGGTTIRIDGEDLLVIQEEHVLGAVEE
jgi:chaperonin GroES